jgi:hypothetical protein
MSDEPGRLLSRNSHQLIHRILDQPDLVAAVHALPAQALGKLVNHVGLEDAGEIVALATTTQLRGIFDDDLWRSPSPGKDETFDADRFALWLEVMLEAGEEFAAAKLAELPEDLVTLAFHKQILVINIEELAIGMSSEDPDDVQVEKALESCLCDELGEYRIIARRHESWNTLFGLMVALDRDHHDCLDRLLERLCALDAAVIEDNGGLYNVLTSEESLESDVAADREDRRAEKGFIAPSSASAFLASARTTALATLVASDERDPTSRAYFRQLRDESAERQTGKEATKAPPAPAAEPAADLLLLLREADVLPSAQTTNLLNASDAPTREVEPFTSSLRALATVAPDVHATRMRELGYLGNVLVAGCSMDRRALRPVEAASATVATCNLGLGKILDRFANPTLALQATPADKLFRIGWNILFHDVVLSAASTAEALLAAHRSTDRRAAASLHSAIAAGKPWLALAALEALQEHIDRPMLAVLIALMDECPSLAGRLSRDSQSNQFISTTEEVRAAQSFLAQPR